LKKEYVLAKGGDLAIIIKKVFYALVANFKLIFKPSYNKVISCWIVSFLYLLSIFDFFQGNPKGEVFGMTAQGSLLIAMVHEL
jgi:hypothetical protein